MKGKEGMAKTQAVAEQDFVAKMEKKLTEHRREIFINLSVSNEEFKGIMEAVDSKDVADVASDDMDRKMIEALGSQELKRLRMIDAALAKIQQGKYGQCTRCSKKIPQARLEALPFAIMCVDCKTVDERRNR
ncbi:MAG: TraR/DksA family transcriptional regulator [Treponema sp.]|jgi:RNA polymerase-binding protein DksA|nr:TraR/DksA family transcriptional regulator [Treponema sp.]